MSEKVTIKYTLSWNEYGQLVEEVWQKLRAELTARSIKIDAVIMVIREGCFTALPLAYKLNSYKVIPIQYKYFLNDGSNELKQIAKIPELTYSLPEAPIFLLCDTWPCGGKTKDLVIAEFKQKWPKAKFVFASIFEDDSVKHEDILCAVSAVDVGYGFTTTHPIFTKAGLATVFEALLPWQNAGEEIAGPNMTNWDYQV